ncbi:TetR/AcrR family transcriptional regulator [Nocardia thailandica]|uniref:TetR/AcrR family transcriptional regulator n=1 Tax=Nocardia thailandica TaxID=257275 RepID=A0ABW6PU64_9NOCA
MTDLGDRTARAYRGATAEERRAARRARLIEAGIAVFGTRGFRAATVEAVAAEAGLIKRYFYESFDSLDTLLAAVYDLVVADLHTAVTASTRTGTDLAGALAGALDGMLAWAQDDPRRARIHLFEAPGAGSRLDERVRDNGRRFAHELSEILRAHTPEMPLSGTEQALLGTVVVGVGQQVTTQWILDGFTPAREQLLADFGKLLLATGIG